MLKCLVTNCVMSIEAGLTRQSAAATVRACPVDISRLTVHETDADNSTSDSAPLTTSDHRAPIATGI